MYENVKILSGKRSKYYHFFEEVGARGDVRVQPHRLLAPFPHSSKRSSRSDRFERARAAGCKQLSDAIDRVTRATRRSAISFVEIRRRGTRVRFYAEKSVSFV